jgi:hypothetical protein
VLAYSTDVGMGMHRRRDCNLHILGCPPRSHSFYGRSVNLISLSALCLMCVSSREVLVPGRLAELRVWASAAAVNGLQVFKYSNRSITISYLYLYILYLYKYSVGVGARSVGGAKGVGQRRRGQRTPGAFLDSFES